MEGNATLGPLLTTRKLVVTCCTPFASGMVPYTVSESTTRPRHNSGEVQLGPTTNPCAVAEGWKAATASETIIRAAKHRAKRALTQAGAAGFVMTFPLGLWVP